VNLKNSNFQPSAVFSNSFYSPFLVMSRLPVRATLVALVLTATSAHAQPAAPAADAPTGSLTLEQCIALAMKKNFDLQIQGFSTDIAKENVVIAQAGFDPTLNSSITRSLTQSANTTSTLDGTTAIGPRADNTSGSIGVTQLLPQTNATLGLSTGVSRAATNSRFSTLNPSYGNNVTATVSQPLLKNAGGTVARATVERNKLGLSIAQLTYQSSVLTVVLNTETAYNNLVSARETQHIRELSLDLAQKLLDENKARRATGTMTDLDVLTAEVGVNNARLAVVNAQQNVRTAEDNLLTLINASDYNQRPGSVNFADYTGGEPSFDLSYKLARENSPDYLSTAKSIQQSEIDLSVAKSGKLPSLNLNGSLGYNNTDHSYDDAIGHIVPHHGNNWSLGLVYSQPWGQKADNARYRSTLATLNSLKMRLSQLDQSLIVQVRAAVSAVKTNLVGVDIAVKATELSIKQYELQKARFDAGLSTSRLVLQAQDDLETARFNELSSKVSLRNSLAQLHRLETSSLQQFKIDLP
jgi:outer membrane protein TolC